MSREPATDPRDGRDSHGQQQSASPDGEALAEYNAEILESRPGLREAFLMMLLEVPEPDDDAAANIVGTILAAERVEDLDKPWDTDGMANYFDQQVTVHSITKRPSDYAGGLGVYLGCECTIVASGEREYISCGSVSSVAELVRAHTLGGFPLTVIPTKAKKETKNGYWPYHLKIVRGGGGQ